MKIDVMTKDKDTKTVVPALRFPEFRDGEGWKIVSLGEVCDVVGGGTPDTKEDSYWNGDILWLTPSEVGNRFISDSCRKITLSGLKNSSAKLLPAGSIVLTTRATLGEMSILVTEASTNQGFQSLVPKLGTNKDYIYYLQPIIKEQCLRFSKGSTFLEVSSTSVKNFKIPFTSNKEQEKVADCLGSMDDLISSVADKIETLKEYKKGLMQQLFPAESKTTPAFRFPEFQNKGEWEEAILGDYVEIKGRIGYRGYTTNDIVEKGEGAISLSPTNITDNGELIFNKCTYISWGKYNESPEIMLDRGYVVLVKTGSSYGKSALVKQLPQKTTINPQIVILKPQKMNDVFLSLLISHNLIQKQINKAIVGGAIPTLSQDSISKFKILIPKIEEQKKIAEYLLSVDELISTETDKLDQLKAHKKGLMQQLFPKLQ